MSFRTNSVILLDNRSSLMELRYQP